VYERVAHSSSPPFKYNWPGILSTLALVLINIISRDDLLDISESGDTDTEVGNGFFATLSSIGFYRVQVVLNSNLVADSGSIMAPPKLCLGNGGSRREHCCFDQL